MVACSSATLRGKCKCARRSKIYARFCVIQEFWLRWVLLCPESCIALFRLRWFPALVACSGAAAQRQNDLRDAWENAKTHVDRRSRRVSFFEPGSAVQGSPSGHRTGYESGTAGQPRRPRLGGLTSGLKFSARAPQPRQSSILPWSALHSLGLRRSPHTVSVPSHACGCAWHLFQYLTLSILMFVPA